MRVTHGTTTAPVLRAIYDSATVVAAGHCELLELDKHTVDGIARDCATVPAHGSEQLKAALNTALEVQGAGALCERFGRPYRAAVGGGGVGGPHKTFC